MTPGKTPPLSDLLRDATWPLHRQVERSTLMRRILGGKFERALYVALLRNLAAIYATLEPLLERHAHHPWIAAILDPALFRATALRKDLAFFGDTQAGAWSGATRRYVQRLNELDVESPHLLLAHAYVRYLGDLSGGQALKRIVARALALQAQDGLRFYEFGDADEVAALSRRFRDGLASIPVDGSTKELLAEAQRAFVLHGDLFGELDPATDT